jgi:hypothetical protein
MVDFRYLLITVVAIFLALTIGILVGSGFLGEPLREDLEGRVETVSDRNRELTEEINRLEAVVGQGDRFAQAIEPHTIDDVLQGQQVVLFTFDDADGSVLEEQTTALGEASADLVSTVTITQKFELASPEDAEQLRLIIGSSATDDEALVQAAARTLGGSAAAAAQEVPAQAEEVATAPGTEETLEELERAGFITVDTEAEEEPIPPGALFLVTGGSTDRPAFDVASFATTLATNLAARDAEVVVTEPTDSVWGLVSSVRQDGEAGAFVSTVDDAETVQGRIAMVLALGRSSEEPAGHYGVEAGADAVIPEPVR